MATCDKLNPPAPVVIDRDGLAERWNVSRETIKRMERAGHLKRIALGGRLVRYRMRDVIAFEERGGA